MHNKIKHRKLGRTASHRKALLRNLANQLIEHKEIRTTTAKAKEARSYVERLITYGKKGDLHHRRLAFSFLRNKQSINVLFDEIAPAYSERQGGYTRVVKLGRRSGDAAEISLLQLVGFEKLGETTKKKSDKKKAKTKDTKAVKKEATPEKAETESIVAENEEEPKTAEVVETEEVKEEEPKAEVVEEEVKEEVTENAAPEEKAESSEEDKKVVEEKSEEKEEDKKE